jgi:hypothetical protein
MCGLLKCPERCSTGFLARSFRSIFHIETVYHVSIESDRLVAGQTIEFEADLATR